MQRAVALTRFCVHTVSLELRRPVEHVETRQAHEYGRAIKYAKSGDVHVADHVVGTGPFAFRARW